MNYLGQNLPGCSMYRPFVYGTKGAVSTNNSYATKAGLEILQKGGNAVDAAVAVSLTLGVVEPYHSGIGGGCFSVFYDKKSNETIAIDARGIAPINAYQDMFLDDSGNVNPEFTEYGGKPVTVPSLYRAMDTLLKKYGTMSLKEVSQPAIDLARNGFKIGFVFERASDSPQGEYNAKCSKGFTELYFKDGQYHRFGETLVNKDLANTMEAVADNGVDSFYNGDIADAIVAQVNARGGVFTKKDMTDYDIKFRPLVNGSYRGYDIVSIGPPSSGGSHIIQMLNILEKFDLKGMGKGSADSTHAIAEAMKIAFADRSVAMGDPDFVDVNIEKVISKEYAADRKSQIDMGKAQAYSPTPGIEAKEYPGNTTHFSIMDQYGNVISQTQTIRNWWGSGVIVNGYGFVLNNIMADFSAKVGVPTTQGLAYGMANAVRGGKTSLSSMSPTIVFKNGEPFMAVGAAGGPRIITCTLQAIINAIDYDLLMDAAVKTPYMTCLTLEQGLELEYGYSPDTIQILKERGHQIIDGGNYGVLLVMVNGVMKRDGVFYPTGTIRVDGGGGVLTKEGSIALDGIMFV